MTFGLFNVDACTCEFLLKLNQNILSILGYVYVMIGSMITDTVHI